MNEFLPQGDDVPSYDEVPPPPILRSAEEVEKSQISNWFKQNPRYKKFPGYSERVSLDDWPDTVDELLNY